MVHSTVRASGRDHAALFAGRPGRSLVGLEVECALVDARTGRSCPVYGSRSSTAVLAELARRLGIAAGDPAALALPLPTGGSLCLELGGAIEYAGPPARTVVDAVSAARTALVETARAAETLGLALITGGLSPFTAASDISWVRKPRIALMRDYFSGLGADGRWSDQVMGLSASTQVTIDYACPDDLSAKAYTAVGASPFVAALLANSPIAEGRATGALSQRMLYWTRVDPRRCGFQDYVYEAGPDAGDKLVSLLIERVSELPIIYTGADDSPGRSASVSPDFLPFRDRYGDGSSAAQLRLHLSQTWPAVRIRDTLELRACDTPPWSAIGSVPALWTGLLYDRAAAAAAREVLAQFLASDLAMAAADIARCGLAARLGGRSVRDIAAELIAIAHGGLSRRVDAGLEPAGVLDLLAPVEHLVRTGRTFADETLRRWTTTLAETPARFVEDYRVPTS